MQESSPRLPHSSVSTTSRVFSVDISENPTVSYKRLQRDAEAREQAALPPAPLGANPALEARFAPAAAPAPPTEEAAADAAAKALPGPTNRFSSVIEKIERIYAGLESNSGEGDGEEPAAGSDEYDTEDSFIDDKELNEYFTLSKKRAKHKGFFVNRGLLEQEDGPSLPAPDIPPKKQLKRKADTEVEPTEGRPAMNPKTSSAPPTKVPQASGAGHGPGLNSVSDKTKIPRPKKISWVPAAPPPHAAAPVSGSAPSTTPNSDTAAAARVADSVRALMSANEKAKSNSSPVPMTAVPNDTTHRKSVLPTAVPTKVVPPNPGSTKPAVSEKQPSAAAPSLWKPVSASKPGNSSSPPGKPHPSQHVVNPTAGEALQALPLPVPTSAAGVVEKAAKHSPSKALKQGMGKRVVPELVGRLSLDDKGSPAAGEKDLRTTTSKSLIKALEHAVSDLEASISTYRVRPDAKPEEEGGAVGEGGSSQQQGSSRVRMPIDTRAKLACVARIASQGGGKIPLPLTNRLEVLVAPFMAPLTLKKHLKDMVEKGKSAKKERDDLMVAGTGRLTELVKERVQEQVAKGVKPMEPPPTPAVDEASVNGEAKPKASCACFEWDEETLAQFHTLYTCYFEQLEDMKVGKGQSARKFYTEMAALWPKGWMDTLGLKKALLAANRMIKGKAKVGGHGSATPVSKSSDDGNADVGGEKPERETAGLGVGGGGGKGSKKAVPGVAVKKKPLLIMPKVVKKGKQSSHSSDVNPGGSSTLEKPFVPVEGSMASLSVASGGVGEIDERSSALPLST